MTPTRPRARILEFRPMRRGSLSGFLAVQFGSGLIMREVAIHVAGSRSWAAPQLDHGCAATNSSPTRGANARSPQRLVETGASRAGETHPEVLAEAGANAEGEAA